MGEPHGQHRWRFFRSGGFDQVRIENAQDLIRLGELDQKLWAVLACPTSGLEFDTRTLQLIDTDGDGRIRVPELREAVRWACAMLNDPDVLFQPGDTLALDAIHPGADEGPRLLGAARQVLERLGKPEAAALAVNDFADLGLIFPPAQPNGDGIVPAELAPDEASAALIGHVIAAQGALKDRSGQPGVSGETLDAFLAAAQQVVDWHAQAETGVGSVMAWGEQTPAALAAFDAVQDKVRDYFTRCSLAAFDGRAEAALNPADTRYAELSALALSNASEEVASLPLAKVATDGLLPLRDGINPAWQARVAALREQVVTPVLGEREQLTQAEWDALAARFGAYREWLAARPATPVADVPAETLRDILSGAAPATLKALIEKDQTAEASATAIEALERLVRLRRDLITLLRNFVNLSDFYGPERPAIFQAGTLYIDQRSCDLCLRVGDMGRHAALAPLSGTYLVYCQCVRQGEPPITIVAAMTGGDADDMMVPGRNGVFYDRQGRDWNASVVKVVEAPISVRQAFWSPYKRISRLIGEQVHKFAASRDKDVEAKAAARVADAGAKADAPAPAADAKPAQAFDIAKFAGIFAAIGLALGALGTALAAVVTGFLRLPAWQMPLVVLGVMLLISGPSMLLAWLKLRKRNVGPLLDANGWAVNIRARINIPFGASLTGVAQLPQGAERSLADPYAEQSSPWPWWILLALLMGGLYWVWRQGWLGG
ncbi:hypothetical protein [Hydrogenophaga aquatica]